MKNLFIALAALVAVGCTKTEFVERISALGGTSWSGDNIHIEFHLDWKCRVEYYNLVFDDSPYLEVDDNFQINFDDGDMHGSLVGQFKDGKMAIAEGNGYVMLTQTVPTITRNIKLD